MKLLTKIHNDDNYTALQCDRGIYDLSYQETMNDIKDTLNEHTSVCSDPVAFDLEQNAFINESQLHIIYDEWLDNNWIIIGY